jgi:uncharacterized protein (TIGR03032 family)
MKQSETRLRESLLKKQHAALRDPAEVVTGNPDQLGISAASLQFTATKSFVDLLEKLKITLLLTREYEHLLLAWRADGGKLKQTFFPLPHPAGIAVDRKKNLVYVAATRNPNAIVEFSLGNQSAKNKNTKSLLMPSRMKFYPGSVYFHDLSFIGGQLYANSVGQNGIVKIEMNSSSIDKVLWMPEGMKGKTDRNHIQLNSIAAGRTLRDSFFSASAEKIIKYKPGDLEFPVDKTGVIFSGRSGKVIARGLTRPHSARLYKGKLWVDNSGYGEFGFIRSGTFVPLVKLPGWTRGLCFAGDVAFVGVSRIIKKYKVYAPGIETKDPVCSVYAINILTGEIIGSMKSNFGNQIFGIDYLPSTTCSGFAFEKTGTGDERIKNIFYNYSL